MQTKGLREFYQEVKQDAKLQQQIAATLDPTRLVDLVVRLGNERGYAFSAEEVTSYLLKNRELSDAELEQASGGTIFRVNMDRDMATIVKKPDPISGNSPGHVPDNTPNPLPK